ncbi:hypothetical protein GUJ93_ZPchr0006g42873 [Zizania palustris]|uniref:Uncharacterized protein n=1 Tax=Zizania palustris TaxID=103762 RepID=A0A8J5T9U7_ZIZPA|nr:hypothetical protein GUJ93_ZPchr0006g42873 [Zizania palustris]
MRPLLVAPPSPDTAAALASTPAKIVITKSGGAGLLRPYKPQSTPVLASSIGGREQSCESKFYAKSTVSIDPNNLELRKQYSAIKALHMEKMAKGTSVLTKSRGLLVFVSGH